MINYTELEDDDQELLDKLKHPKPKRSTILNKKVLKKQDLDELFE